MSVGVLKTRVVFFRVTQQEFDEVVLFCGKKNIRSISDFARAGLRRMLEESQEERRTTCQQECVMSLQKEIDALRVEVERLLCMLQSTNRA